MIPLLVTAALVFSSATAPPSPVAPVAERTISPASPRTVDQAPVMGARSPVVLDHCMVHLIEDVELPAQEAGPLVLVSVREGQAIEAGQLLARVDSTLAQRRLEEAEAMLQAARRRADDDIEVLYAQAAYDVADQEYRINVDLNRSISTRELERSRLARRQAELAIQRAQNQRELAALDLQALEVNHRAAQDHVDRHAIHSPVDGNVMEVYRQAGEWVSAGDPVMRVVRMNRLQVRGWLNASELDPHEIENRPVTVTLPVARGQRVQFSGQVVFVGLERHAGRAGAEEYSVWAEVENRSSNGRWILLPRSEVQMVIELDPR